MSGKFGGNPKGSKEIQLKRGPLFWVYGTESSEVLPFCFFCLVFGKNLSKEDLGFSFPTSHLT